MSAQEVELLPRWLVNLYRFLVGLCVIIFSTGVVGAYIMADLQREKRISHTWFAEMIYSMTRFNRMAVPALVNGSVVIAVIAMLNVRNHGIAVRPGVWHCLLGLLAAQRIRRDVLGGIEQAKLLPHQVLKGEALEAFFRQNDLDPTKKPKKRNEGKKKR